MNQRKTIEVVAAVICDGDRVFATQRGYGEWKDWWEFPGGKMEPGETPEEALMREIREELATEDCSRTAAHNGGARLSEVPPHHALLPLSGGQRKTHAAGT